MLSELSIFFNLLRDQYEAGSDGKPVAFFYVEGNDIVFFERAFRNCSDIISCTPFPCNFDLPYKNSRGTYIKPIQLGEEKVLKYFLDDEFRGYAKTELDCYHDIHSVFASEMDWRSANRSTKRVEFAVEKDIKERRKSIGVVDRDLNDNEIKEGKNLVVTTAADLETQLLMLSPFCFFGENKPTEKQEVLTRHAFLKAYKNGLFMRSRSVLGIIKEDKTAPANLWDCANDFFDALFNETASHHFKIDKSFWPDRFYWFGNVFTACIKKCTSERDKRFNSDLKDRYSAEMWGSEADIAKKAALIKRYIDDYLKSPAYLYEGKTRKERIEEDDLYYFMSSEWLKNTKINMSDGATSKYVHYWQNIRGHDIEGILFHHLGLDFPIKKKSMIQNNFSDFQRFWDCDFGREILRIINSF